MESFHKILHVVLAEDDADEREFFKESLESLNLGVTLDMYKNGKELLAGLTELLKVNRFPDIIFLDLNMPILNGLDSLTKIRSLEEFKNIPIITIFTTSDADIDKKISYERGANAFISKPSNYSTLALLIKEALETDWANRETDLSNFVLTLK